MITVNDSISVRIYPGKVPVIFLHAFPMNATMWEPQMHYLRERGWGYVAVNYPGFGGSAAPPEAPNIFYYASRVKEVLTDLQVPKAVFVGLSMGGYVALALFRQAPHYFAGLLLANTRAAADSEEGRTGRYAMIEQLRRHPDTSELVSSYLEKFFTAQAREANKIFVKKAREIMQQASAEAIIKAQQAMASRPDSFDLLPRMNFPVIVVAGEQDSLTPVEEAEKMASQLPRGELVVIPGAAHLSNLEQENLFNQILERLLRQVEQASGH